jgi:hypothetical protein
MPLSADSRALDKSLNLSYTLRMILWHRLPQVIVVCSLAAAVSCEAQAPRPTANTAALFDPTGYWVSIVTEDWRFCMITPPKGDYTGISLNAEGRRIADAWDPAKDEAAGEQCRSYGAHCPSITRLALIQI